ncbi:branched-chain amino acid transport system II carrier protein, partial [Shewanella marina]|uniref:branched-chain amino acid transport system II carrier protein n=1 Tax=Shewanella marina TaxID=487319 RepID=UPI00056C787B
ALLLVAPLRKQLSQTAILVVMATALVFGSMDAVHILGAMPAALNNMLLVHLPLYSYFAGWVVPTLFMLVAGIVVNRIMGANTEPQAVTQ